MSLADVWRERLAELADDPPLGLAAAWLAAEEGSGATPERVEDALRALADGVRPPADAPLPDRLARVLHHLFVEEGFAGDTEDYDDPRNSCIDQVLERRRGLPILLSIVLVEVGRRIGVPLHGIGFPGHFLVGTARGAPRFVDPFHRGALRDPEVLRAELSHALARPADDDDLARALRPTPAPDVLLRMSNNLLQSWLRRGNLAGALRNADRRVGLRPDLPEVHRDRGRLRARLGLRDDAIDDLTHYLAVAPDAPDAAAVSVQLSLLLR